MNEVNKLFKKQLKNNNLSIFNKIKEYVSKDNSDIKKRLNKLDKIYNN